MHHDVVVIPDILTEIDLQGDDDEACKRNDTLLCYQHAR